jgi:hypothetical protein
MRKIDETARGGANVQDNPPGCRRISLVRKA